MFLAVIVISIVAAVYASWFRFEGTLSSGDWPYLFAENIREFTFSPQPQFLWLALYYQIPTKIFVEYVNIPWEIVERLFWFWPFLALSIVSSYVLTRSWIGVLIYTTNSYILMVVSGGQMGVAMAYAIAPLVLAKFMNLVDSQLQTTNRKVLISTGLVLTVLVMFDPRIGYATLLSVLLYFLFHFRKKAILKIFLVPIVLTIALNLYWILSMIRSGVPVASADFANLEGFRFLSFADFSNAISLLHPNYPENIFGKVSFMKPEFLALPIFAFASLFFGRSDKRILFFALLGLFGAFLAKGAHEPFGMVNEFLFQYIPGMSMFRDATKFYVLIALSYSVLIPFSIDSLYGWFRSKIKNQKFNISFVYLLFTIYYLLFLILPAWMGELGGTFRSREVPQSYVELKNQLLKETEFFNTFWIPSRQRFGFSSKNHPAIDAQAHFDTSSIEEIMDKLTNQDGAYMSRELSVRYVIVAYDSERELFLTDRKYDEALYNETIQRLEEVTWLVRRPDFGKIAVFEVQ